MTELHFLLNDLPASTSHTIPSSAMKRKETAAKKKGKPFVSIFEKSAPITGHFGAMDALFPTVFLKKHKCSSSKAHTFAFPDNFV